MPGGISRFSQSLCRNFFRMGIDVRVLTPAPPSAMEDFQVIRFSEPSKWKKLKRVAIWKPLRDQIINFKPDVIFLASSHPYGYLIYHLCRCYRIPFVVGAHGTELFRVKNNKINRLWQWLEKKGLAHAKAVLCVSKYSESLVKSIIPSANTKIVCSGVDLPFFLPGDRDIPYWSSISKIDLSDKFIVVSLARLAYWKGIDVLLQAIHQLQSKIPNLVCLSTSVGEEYNNLVALREKLSLGDRVVFLGELPREKIPSLLQTADVLVQVSRREPGEGFGLVFIEANACGIPVIGSRAGAIPEVVQEGKTGLLVDPDNPQQLADAIKSLHDDAILRQTLIQNGLLWAKGFEWSNVASKCLETMESLVP
ncbi:MAG: glycosyltransferase family 4 protein [bacterium]|nr:glycosyltransferase family 4 protein [bacterium]